MNYESVRAAQNGKKSVQKPCWDAYFQKKISKGKSLNRIVQSVPSGSLGLRIRSHGLLIRLHL